MDLVRDVCSATLSVRKAHQRRVRLPLNSVTVASADADRLADFVDVIADEVNVRRVELTTDVASVATERLQLVPAKLGPRLGKDVQQVIKAHKTGAAEVRLAPYGVIARHGLPKMQNFFVVHEGMVRRADGRLEEVRYKDVVKLDTVPVEGAAAEVVESAGDGWIGFTDHYWMTTLVPEQGKPWKAVTKYVPGALCSP